MATVIQIDYDVPAERVAQVQALLDWTATRHVDWSGAEFRLERGDSTCIVNDDSADAATLYARILAVIAGHADAE